MGFPIDMVQAAKDLLGADNVSAEMAEYLKEAEGFCCEMGGVLASRQVTALAIATWRQMERNKESCKK